ncbi:MAG: hypothetical protein JSU70_10885 [Phycisphaerales bacterium]|nr:MAG: hypothetical protein JSU70_10885 [Phycisphaerales bacterium]
MLRKPIGLALLVVMLGLTQSAQANDWDPNTDPDLVAWWPFDETSGTTAADASGNGNDGALAGGAVWVAGKVAGALEFNGSNARVVAPNIPLNSRSYTIMMWVNPVLYTGEQVVFSTGLTGANDTDMHYRLGGPGSGNVPPGGVRMGFYNNDLDTAGGIITDNEWYHITFWYDFENQLRRIYVDGVQQAQDSGAPYLGTSGDTVIGAWGTGQWFRGIIDDARIYSRPLSAAEIASFVPPQLTAYDPSPADGAEGVDTPLMQWSGGDTAVFHLVYFGTDPDNLTFIGEQSWMVYWHPAGLTPGATYYWRIDEKEGDGTIHTGDLWSFTATPLIAWEPSPADGATDVMITAQLSWRAGKTVTAPVKHHVFFGTDQTEVADGTGDTDKGIVDDPSYDPGTLKAETVYYWRVNEVESDGSEREGDVWSFETVPAGPGKVLREWWLGFAGTAVSVLTSNARYPDNPDGYELVDLFEGPVNWQDNYGSRLSGWLFPPATGDYTFWIATDDGGECWLSTDEDPANAVLICSVEGWVPSRDFDGTAGVPGTNLRSAPVTLEAGKRYYIEAMMKEGGGGDNIAVAWQGPGIPVREVISGEYVGPTPFLPERAYAPSPGDGGSDVPDTVMLTWQAGVKAVQHELYFGTDQAAVAAADTTTPGIYRGLLSNTSYMPTESPLVWAQTYYWKINEKNNDGTMSLGRVWSFTVADHIIVDDFEDYNDYSPDRIFQTWIDGFGYTDPPPGKTGNGTGSTVGYLTAPFAEQTIVHGGGQSMPFGYDNSAFPFYSEAEREWLMPQNFNRSGVEAMTLYFYGTPPAFMENPPGTYTIGGSGTDIWGNFDEFRFVYKQLTGDGEISARVANIGPGTNTWAKAGVMMRESLDGGSKHMMMVLTGGAGGGITFQGRQQTGDISTGLYGDITAAPPHWVKLTRAGDTFTAYHSDTGADDDWELFTDDTPDGAHTNPMDVMMGGTVLVGLAVTSHDAATMRGAEFTNVSTVGSVMGAWQVADVGVQQPAGNTPQGMYVALEDSTGTSKMVPHGNTGATALGGWNEWNIDLSEFEPVNLSSIRKMYIGVGNRLAPSIGGTGDLFIDDIRLYRPRCVPSELTLSDADLNSDCVVDYRDLEIMTGDWLSSAAGLAGDLDADDDVDSVDYAALADAWLEEMLWPAP